jgi:hypothetical protein
VSASAVERNEHHGQSSWFGSAGHADGGPGDWGDGDVDNLDTGNLDFGAVLSTTM